MKKIKLIIVMFLLGLPFFSQANSEDAFPISTEMQIGKMRNLIDRAPGGIYLTVGGERAFRGASMYEKIKQLIIVDVSTVIVRFNKINIELLKAINKEQYKNLRWNADFKEWRTISALLTEDDFKWWNKNIRNIKGHELPESLNKTGTGNRYIKIREKLLAVYPRISERFNNRKSVFLKFVTWEDIKYNQIYLKPDIK